MLPLSSVYVLSVNRRHPLCQKASLESIQLHCFYLFASIYAIANIYSKIVNPIIATTLCRCPHYVAVRREFLTNAQIILKFVESEFRQLKCLKFY